MSRFPARFWLHAAFGFLALAYGLSIAFQVIVRTSNCFLLMRAGMAEFRFPAYSYSASPLHFAYTGFEVPYFVPEYYLTNYGTRIILIPFWPVLLVVVLGEWWLWRHPHSHQSDECSSCGYSLNGNVSGICPECGTEAEQREGDQ